MADKSDVGVAVITGATRGLGAALSFRLAKAKLRVVGVSRGSEPDADWISTVEQFHAVHVVGDASLWSVAERAFETANSIGEIKILVNCCGTARFGPFEAINLEDLDATIGSNLKSAMIFCREALRSRSKGQLKIVNVCSTAAFASRANEVAYTAAKWGLRGFTEALRAELKGTETNIFGVYPGGMQTRFWESADPTLDVSKFVSPSEVAEAIEFQLFQSNVGYLSDITVNRK